MDARALLARMGWAGGGLGKRQDGRAKPVDVVKKEDNHGVGPKRDWLHNWESAFDEVSRKIAVPSAASPAQPPPVAKHLGRFVKASASDAATAAATATAAAAESHPRDAPEGERLYEARVRGKLKRLREHEERERRRQRDAPEDDAAAERRAARKRRRALGEAAAAAAVSASQ